MLLSFSLKWGFAQKKEMSEYFKNGNLDKAIELGKLVLENEPNDFETILLMARAENEKGEFQKATPYLKMANELMNENWQKSWTLIEMSKNYFGLGKTKEASIYFKKASRIEGTKSSMKELKKFGMVSGLDEYYNNWIVIETENLIFHFEEKIDKNEVERISKTRQKAYEEIIPFFDSKLPKKIDFFVWNLTESFNPVLNSNLGFTKPIFCVSHNRLNQSPGHEITHNISFWKNIKNIRTKFINEGIGVCFDLQKNDKITIAKELYASNPVEIRKMWEDDVQVSEDYLYAIGGAFVEYLINFDKNKFLLLVDNQTYENADKIYNGELDKIIKNFVLLLTKE